MKEILDESLDNQIQGPKWRLEWIIVSFSVLTAVLFFLYGIVNGGVPWKVVVANMEINVTKLLYPLTMYVMARLLTKAIYKLDPDRSNILFFIHGASSLFFAIIIYQLSVQYFITKLGLGFAFSRLLIIASLWSILGGLIAFYRIHVIRKENALIPALLLIAYVIGIVTVEKYYPGTFT